MEAKLTQLHKLKIAMICAEYPPKPGPGPTRMAAFAKGLVERGYEPRVFTSEQRTGSLAAQWRKIEDPLCSEDGATGSFGQRGATQSLLEKVVNFWVPMEPVYTLSLPSIRRTFAEVAKREEPDLIFVTSNPLASAVGGVLLKRRHGLPLVVEFRDPWTQNPVRNWPTRLHFNVESLLERWVLQNADAVIMNTPTARSNLLAKYSWLDSAKVHVISHGFDGPSAQHTIGTKEQARYGGSRDHVRIAYIGGFYAPWTSAKRGGIRGLIQSFAGKVQSANTYNIQNSSTQERGSSPATLLRAIAEHNATALGTLPRIKMDVIGGEPRQLHHYVSSFGLEEGDVTIRPRVARDDVRQVLQNYDLLYLTNPAVQDSPFIGTKTFDYIAAGRPIIAELADSDQARLIASARAGWLCSPGCHEAIRAIFREALWDNCKKIRTFQPDWEYVDLFARRHQVNDLVQVIEQAAGRNPKRTVVSDGYLKMRTGSKTEVA